MPYLHCPNCRITIFKPRLMMEANEPRGCPSCGAALAQKPRPLFAARAGARKLKPASPSEPPSAPRS